MVRSAFFEFHVALTGLHASRAGLEVTGHNTSNAATVGFSRQYIEQKASFPLTYRDGKGMIGTGAVVYGIGQVRNFYLDKKYWDESAVLGEYTQKNSLLSVIEGAFSELGDMSVTTNVNLLFDRLQDLSGSSHDGTYRTNVLQALEQFATFINTTSDLLKKQQRDINAEVKTIVETINSLGQQISDLNEQIMFYETDGSRANDLRDQRALLVDELSRYVNVEVDEIELNDDYANGLYPNPEDRFRSRKLFQVMINGSEFVTGDTAYELKVKPRDAKRNTMDAEFLYDVYIAHGAIKFDIYSPTLKGELKGLIDVRDGNNGVYCGGSATAVTGPAPVPPAQPNTYTVTITNPTKIDLLETDGYVTLRDTQTGVKRDYEYSGYVYDSALDTATFTVIANSPINTVLAYEASVGQTDSYKGIPHYMNKLNELVRTMARAFNEGVTRNGSQIPDVTGHIDAYDLNGDKTNLLLFTYLDYSTPTNPEVTAIPTASASPASPYDLYYYLNYTCDNFQVNSILQDNPDLLGAAEGPTDGESANQVINNFDYIRQYNRLFSEGKLIDYTVGMAGELGIDLKQAGNFEDNYISITLMINQQRTEVSGVDLNEEMVNMVKYQQVYQASAQMITTINEVYDTLINRMGVS
ncbi:MAG: flagellar hook-associated protein FlgK [Clostridiales bacterium]|jgi:flagellar hook-associated protein 1 FlgK|nr:flagellar hook-associated protein FlgK [Clostridiales bacterium]